MLTAEKFNQLMIPLTESFTVVKPEVKLKHYYMHLKNCDAAVLTEAVDLWLREEDRFPTINQLAEKIRHTKVKFGFGLPGKKAECHYCDGVGLVSAVDTDRSSYTYRCCCDNAARYSSKIPAWFGQSHGTKQLIPRRAYQDVSANPEIYKKGLAWIKANGLKIPAHIQTKMQAAIGGALNQKPEDELVDDCPY